MADFLVESGNRALRPGIVQPFMHGANAKYEEDIKTMNEYVNESTYLVQLLRQRDDNVLSVYDQCKANPTDKKDILNLMMNGKDKETGQGLSEKAIKNNVSRSRAFYQHIYSSRSL